MLTSVLDMVNIFTAIHKQKTFRYYPTVFSLRFLGKGAIIQNFASLSLAIAPDSIPRQTGCTENCYCKEVLRSLSGQYSPELHQKCMK